MITFIRSALLCEKYERNENDTTNYLGVLGGEIVAESRPGFVSLTAGLQLGTDGRPTDAEIVVEWPGGGGSRYALRDPTGVATLDMQLPIIIAVEEAGELTISVRQTEAKAKPLRMRWRVSFAADAPALSAELAEKVRREAREIRKTVSSVLTPPASPTTKH